MNINDFLNTHKPEEVEEILTDVPEVRLKNY